MDKKNIAGNLYLLNVALLFTHQADAAFWHEWDLFGIPGGIQMFLIVNFLLLLVALFGYRQLILGAKGGYGFSLLIAFVGLFAFFIHTYFILAGHPEFKLPVSLATLVLMLIVSLVQGWVTMKELRGKS